MVTVVDASGKFEISPTMLTFTTEACDEINSPDQCWNREQEVTVTVDQDDDAVSETVTLTHTATVGEDDVTLSNSSVTVTITDTNPDRGVTVSTPTLAVPEAGRNSYMVKLESKPPAR